MSAKVKRKALTLTKPKRIHTNTTETRTLMTTNSLTRVSMIFPVKKWVSGVRFDESLIIGPIMKIHLEESDDISYDCILARYLDIINYDEKGYRLLEDFFPGTFVKHGKPEYSDDEVYAYAQFDTVNPRDICFIDDCSKETPAILASAGEYILFIHKSLQQDLEEKTDDLFHDYSRWMNDNKDEEEQDVKRQKKSESE